MRQAHSSVYLAHDAVCAGGCTGCAASPLTSNRGASDALCGCPRPCIARVTPWGHCKHHAAWHEPCMIGRCAAMCVQPPQGCGPLGWIPPAAVQLCCLRGSPWAQLGSHSRSHLPFIMIQTACVQPPRGCELVGWGAPTAAHTHIVAASVMLQPPLLLPLLLPLLRSGLWLRRILPERQQSSS